MRIKSRITTIKYAGRTLIGQNDYFDGESISGERSYTTAAEALVMSESPHLVNYGNASGRQTFSVSRDFEDFEELLGYLMETTSFADANQTGTLTIEVADNKKSISAGLVSLGYEIALVASPRLLLTWEFLLK